MSAASSPDVALEMGSEFTSDFLQDVLRRYERDETLVVTDLHRERACPVGSNFTSEATRITVVGHTEFNGEKKEFKKRIVTKQFVKNQEYNDLYNFSTPFKNEAVAYFKILPELQKHVVGELPFCKCIFANESKTILEDLCVEGYTMVDKRKGFTLPQIDLALKALAKLHSASIVLHHRDKPRLLDLARQVDEVVFTNKPNAFLDSQTDNLKIAISIFSKLKSTPRNLKALRMLEKLETCSRAWQCDIINRPRTYRVINHGDYSENNILIRSDDAKLVDLQVMRYTSVACDLSYFFYSNRSPKMRKEHSDEWLDLYLRSLRSFVAESGLNLDDVLTPEWLRTEMDEFRIFGFMTALWLMPVFFLNDEDLDVSKGEHLNDSEYVLSKVTPELEERVLETVYEFMECNKAMSYLNGDE